MSNKSLQLAFLLTIGAASGGFCGLAIAASQRNYVERSWGTEEGLPQASVDTLLQSRDGYLWIGTEGGVARFDGVAFKTFDPSNTPGLAGRSIVSLAEDHLGNIWIATWGTGLSRLKDGTAITYSSKDGLPSDFVYAVHEDASGTIWVGTQLGGLSRFTKGSFQRIPGTPSTLRRIVEDGKHRLWASGIGIVMLEDGVPRRRWGAGTPFARSVSTVFKDASDRIWVAVGKALYLYDGNDFTFKTDGSWEQVWDATNDAQGDTWIATNAGVMRMRDGSIEAIESTMGLNTNTVLADGDGNIWAGPSGRGLMRWRETSFRSFSKRDGLVSNDVLSIARDRSGTVWIGTSAGLTRLRGRETRSYSLQDGLPSLFIGSLVEDGDGGMWVGTSAGLSHLQNGRFKNYSRKNGLSMSYVFAILPTRDGRLLIAGNAGVPQILDGNGHFNSIDVAGLGSIRYLYEAHDGSIWICGALGLGHWSRPGFERFGSTQDNFTSVYEDGDDVIWASTVSGGIVRVQGGKLSRTRQEGAFAYVFARVMEDRAGALWLTSSNGVFRVPKPELAAFLDGKGATPSVMRYGTEDGLASSACSIAGQSSTWKDPGGAFWIGSERGVTVITPDQAELGAPLGPALMDRIVVNGVDVDTERPLRFGPGIDRIDFHYTAIALSNGEDVRFQYRLKGWDQGWLEAGARRTASYTNLPLGAYEFRVRTSNRSNAWHDSAPVSFEVLGHAYDQPWLRWAAALAISAILIIAHRFRLSRARTNLAQLMAQRIRERARMAREIHDTLLQGVIGLSLVLDSATQTTADPQMQGTLSNALKQIDELVVDTRLAMMEMRPAGLEGQGVGDALTDFAAAIQERFHLECRAIVRGPVAMIKDPVESELFRIAQEATANSVRHAKAASVLITLEVHAQRVTLNVKDDGCGFDPRTSTSGAGLRNIKERAEALDGEAVVLSDVGQGTTVMVGLPLKAGLAQFTDSLYRRRRRPEGRKA